MGKEEAAVVVGWISAVLIAGQFLPAVYEVCVVEHPSVLPFGTRLLSVAGSVLALIYACLLGSDVGVEWDDVAPVLFINSCCLFSVLFVTVMSHWKNKKKTELITEFNYEEIGEP